ncbi:hypothetical protein U1Q18_016311 [Sarracenia purpurea var. burkii]
MVETVNTPFLQPHCVFSTACATSEHTDHHSCGCALDGTIAEHRSPRCVLAVPPCTHHIAAHSLIKRTLQIWVFDDGEEKPLETTVMEAMLAQCAKGEGLKITFFLSTL